MKRFIYLILFTLFLFTSGLSKSPPCLEGCDDIAINIGETQNSNYTQEVESIVSIDSFCVDENISNLPSSIDYLAIDVIIVDQNMWLLCIPDYTDRYNWYSSLTVPYGNVLNNVDYPLAFKLRSNLT